MTCLFFPSPTRMVTIEFFKHLKTVYSNFLFGKHAYAGVDIVIRVLQFFFRFDFNVYAATVESIIAVTNKHNTKLIILMFVYYNKYEFIVYN